MKHLVLFFCFAFFILSANQPAGAAETSFDDWIITFKQKAKEQGISEPIINDALNNIEPINRVIELDRKQPESTLTFAQYRERIVHPIRIKRGREMLAKHRDLLEQVADKYGVQPQYIVALWGIETNYGSNTGGFDVIASLATLAWDGRRSSFFTKELLNALKILDEGHIARANIKGSWAGALGQNQFMPSSFHNFAVDGNQDGKKDIWKSLDDVFASSANYLAKSGWKAGERWGRAVKVPSGFDKNLTGLDTKKSLAEWQKLGIRTSAGNDLPNVDDMTASIVAPDGLDGATFLVYNNYRTIMRWNRSTYFATSVGLLADSIAQ